MFNGFFAIDLVMSLTSLPVLEKHITSQLMFQRQKWNESLSIMTLTILHFFCIQTNKKSPLPVLVCIQKYIKSLKKPKTLNQRKKKVFGIDLQGQYHACCFKTIKKKKKSLGIFSIFCITEPFYSKSHWPCLKHRSSPRHASIFVDFVLTNTVSFSCKNDWPIGILYFAHGILKQ